MRFAYADPPYLGCGKYYAAHHAEWKTWDDPETHRRLIQRLQDQFPDGWALSLRERGLQTILPMCPPAARVGCWLSERPRFAPKLAVLRYFEPVIWVGGRTYADTGSRAADYVVTKQRVLPAHKNRYSGFYKDQPEIFLGIKPRAFSRWVFDLLGARKGDDFCDLFPGSGAVSSAWAEFCGDRAELPFELESP